MADKRVIRFVAQIHKMQTLVDGGLRLTLDMSESEIATATAMMECKRRGAILEIVAVPIEKERKNKSEYGL